MPFTRDQQISYLSPTTTFYDWWQKENDEIIEKLNQLRVFSATGGAGILASTDINGLLTISLGGSEGVTQGITFSGDVQFTGNTILPNISYKVTGITSGTSGFTFGTPVWVDTTATSGYSAGNCTSADSSEIVGLITQRTTTYSTITVCGKIDGDFKNTESKGSDLSAGCIYFLSDTTGKITTTEPTTDGYVSKPLLMGLGATSGVVLPLRGQLLDSSSGSGGNTYGANDIFVLLPSSSSSVFTVNKVVSYFPDENLLEQYLSTDPANRDQYAGWFLSRSGSVKNGAQSLSPFTNNNEEDAVVGTITQATAVGGSNYLYRITTFGAVPIDLGDPGYYYISNDWTSSANQLIYNSSATYEGKLYAIQYDSGNHTIVNRNLKGYGSQQASFLLSASTSTGSTAGSLTKNQLLNGDFLIWQREDGKLSGYTGQENLIFADMWRRVDGITGATAGTKDFRIERKTFDDYQTSIEGNPEYYLQVKALAATCGATADYITIGHVIPSAKAFNDQDVVLSFYMKCSHNSYSVDLYYARYNNGIQADKTLIDSITPSTSWQRFDVTFTITDLADLLTTRVDDYTEIGFDLIPLVRTAINNAVSITTNVYVDIASVCLFPGDRLFSPHTHEEFSNRLNECRRYYFSSYDLEQYAGKAVLFGGEEILGTPNHTYLPLNDCNFTKWTVPMRTDPTVTIYSPYSGQQSDAYNYDAGRDCRLTSGTFGYNGANRVAILNTPTTSVESNKNGVKVCVTQGRVIYDKLFYHIIADADYPLPS
jgi:hypothetical protein